MKSKSCTCFLFLSFVLLLVVFACNKGENADDDLNPDNPTNPSSTDSTFDGKNLSVNAATCPSAPNYGDSIVYLKPRNGGDFFADPVNNIGVQGYISFLARRS